MSSVSVSEEGAPEAERSEVEALNETAFSLVSADPDRAYATAELAHTLARETLDARHLAWASLTKGLVLVGRGDPEAARLELSAAETHFETAQDLLGLRETQEGLGRLALNLGEVDAARTPLEAALALARQGGDLPAEARLLNLLAGVEHRTGQYTEALRLLKDALDIQARLGDESEQANLHCNIGLLQISTGNYQDALIDLTSAYKLLRTISRNDRTMNLVLLNLGILYFHLEDLENARVYIRDALVAARERGDRIIEVTTILNLGYLRQKQGALPDAERHFEDALRLARAVDYKTVELSALDGLGGVLAAREDLVGATAMHEAALGIAREIRDLEGELDALRHLGELHGRLHDPERGAAYLQEALDLAGTADHKKALSATHLALSELHERAGDPARALHHYKSYHDLERVLFNEEGARRMHELTAQFDVERARHETEVERLGRELAERAREVAEALVRERTLELEQAQLEVVERLAIAAEERDDLTGEHTERVGRFAALIARELGLASDEVATLRVAARLHDVGKIGISDLILLKPGRLTAEEFERMKTHTLIGARILSGGRSRLLAMAEQIALSHHERWDGGGYPHGRAGEDIPLPGRIVAVADVYDALTRDRPYKSAWSVREALSEIASQAGEHFDPTVVAAALRVLGQDEG